VHVALEGDLVDAFRRQAAFSEAKAPLYRRICGIIADDPTLVDLLHAAPAEQRLPVLLLGVIHDLLLGDPTVPLAAYYPNLTPSPRSEGLEHVFRAFCYDHIDAIQMLLATRRTQTNEVGRSSLFLPALGVLAGEVGTLAHLDVGASAGLNLQLERFHYEYQPGGEVGSDSAVELHCGTRGDVPIPSVMPQFAGHLGLDINPIDVSDEAETRWLMACVWPDQPERFHRLQAAILLARQFPHRVIKGDAVDDLATTIDQLPQSGHPVVTNSWVLNYLPVQSQRRYLAELDRVGAGRDLSWIYVEAPVLIPGIATQLDDFPNEEPSVLTMVRWRGGRRSARRLATCHPHGVWMHWN
jgi:hypothetical protein